MIGATIAGSQLSRCARCDGVFVSRQALLAMRRADRHDHPMLAAKPDPGSDVVAATARACPACGEAMQRYRYRGGATTADRCDRCDALYLDRGELGAILEEWRSGIEMDPEAAQALQGLREERLLGRWLEADGALASLGIAAVALFAWLVLRGDRLGWRLAPAGVALAGAVVVGWYLYNRRALRRERRAARRELQRTVRQRGSSGRGKATPAKDRELLKRCPWCGASIPSIAERCNHCDSDIF